MALTSTSSASAILCQDVRFMVKLEDTYIFTFHKLHKSWRKSKAPPKLYFYKYPKDQELCVVSALNDHLKRTETWRANGDKFQLLLSYIKPHVKVHSSTVSRWIKEILKETGVDADVFKGDSTLSASISSTYQVFQWMIYLVEDHGQMNLPGKISVIINKWFQRSNFFRKVQCSIPYRFNVTIMFWNKVMDS